jgi:hypothetical protein
VVVTNKDMGVVFYHDFPLTQGLNAFDTVKAKYTHLAKRWRETMQSDKKILFVRHYASMSEGLALRLAIHEAYPQLQYDILVVNDGVAVDWGISNLINATINPTDADWRGDMAGWTRIFRKLGL